MTLEKTIVELAQKTRLASSSLTSLSALKKNDILLSIAELLESEKKVIQAENKKDLDKGIAKGLSSAMLDRLTLSDSVIDSMISGVKELVSLPDPVGKIEDFSKRPNGLQVGRMRVPLGVIAMIYESRPNVTVDAAALCIKTGNGVILRGGSEAIHSNLVLAEIIGKAIEKHGVSADIIQVVPVVDREAVTYLLQQEEYIDLVIPRGGEGLIKFVVENSRIPVLKHYKGVCHVYVDKDADLDKALPVILNSKTHRTGVCNALEGILIHQDIAKAFLPVMTEALQEKDVELRGCENSCSISPSITPANDADWGTEFLDLKACVKVVAGFDEAKEYLFTYGSQHTESIITENYTTAQKFLTEVDASAVMVNASTRFNDGGQLGLGAEIGISTTKLHSYGPMGLEELTTRKFVVLGEGHIRS